MKGRNDEGQSHRRFGWIRSPIFLGVLVVIALVLLASRLHPAEQDLVRAYRHFSWQRLPWLFVALGAEGISFVCYATVQRFLLRIGGARLTRRTMLALAVAATGLTNLVPGGTAPASGWLVRQYRRREVPMPLALWAVLAGGFAATVSILLLLLTGAGIAGLLGSWEFVGCTVALIGGAVGVVAGVHNLPALTRWLERHQEVLVVDGRGVKWGGSSIRRTCPHQPGVTERSIGAGRALHFCLAGINNQNF